MFPFFDWTFILLLPALALAIWAQWKVRSTFREFSQISSRGGLTGAEVARRILRTSGVSDVAVDHVPGELSDHYDPTARQVNLSESTFANRSIASLAVAAHECGHVMQHAQGYQALLWRAKLVPVASIGSTAAFPLFVIGLIFSKGIGLFLMDLGIALFMFALLFHLVTLPVEFNASNRALAILEDSGMLARDEMPGARAVLRAAAWTYVASATMALMSLIRLLILRQSVRD